MATEELNQINNRVGKKSGSRWYPEPLEVRFWKKVERLGNDDCWTWLGGYFKNGYGAFALTSKKIVKAPRMAYELTYGSIDRGLITRHKCDNPACCNPNHLLLGTHKDNAVDRNSRNRQAKGGKGGMAKLSEEQAIDIKTKRNAGVPRDILANEYNVCKSTISNIHHEVRWKHLS